MLAPENTLPAFRKAVELGVEYLEVDVQQTTDGHLVVLHDKSVSRTTNGGGNLREYTLDELKKLDAGTWFSDAFKGEQVPTLQEVVNVLDDRTKLLLEIKYGTPYHDGIERRLIDFIRERRLENRVLIKSFDPIVIKRVRSLAPEIPVGISIVFRVPFLSLIVHRGMRFGNVLEEDMDFIHVHRIGMTEALVARAHKRGISVIAWDVHDEATMRRFIAYGVDAIETDEAGLPKEIRSAGTPNKIKMRRE